MSAGALSGIRVLELGQYIAGPFAATLLAEQGADVIKVERPGGDPYRKEDGFMVWNRSKKSIVLDLKKKEGVKAALELASGSDVIIENFRPGVMDRLELGYEAVKSVNPGIVYISISGFGTKGFYSGIPGYEPIVSSMASVYAEQGYTTRPLYLVLPLASIYTAVESAFCAVSGLCARETSGKGQKIEVSLFRTILGTFRQYLIEFDGALKGIWGPYGQLPFYRPYQCKDGKWFFLGTGNPKFITLFALAMGHDEWLTSPLFEGAPYLTLPHTHAEATIMLRQIFMTRTRDEWLELLIGQGIPAAPVQFIDDFMDNAQVRAVDMLKVVEQPGTGMVEEMGIPVLASLTPGGIKGPAPALGQNTKEILGTLGHQPVHIKEAQEKQDKSGQAMKLPFENIRVADFTTMLAGAGVGRELADLGADVIKVEPLDGDPWRMLEAGFMGVNRNKRGMVIDIRNEEARAIVYRLISTCQVLIENSRPGIMQKLGLDYESVKRINPDIIYVSQPAFGSKGPDFERPGYDPLFQALSGQMAAQGGPGKTPVFHRISINDEMGALLGAYAASLAIFHKTRTGQGQFMETSLLRAAVTLQSGQFIRYKGMKRKYIGKPDIRGESATNRMYQAKDGEWLYVCCAKEQQWQAMCRVISMPGLAEDPRFSTPAARKRHDGALGRILADIFLLQQANIWTFMLILQGVPAAWVQHMDDLLHTDQHCQETGVFVTQQHPRFGTIKLQGPVPELSETPAQVKRLAPVLGQHTDEVLFELGYTPEQIAAFKAGKMVMQAL